MLILLLVTTVVLFPTSVEAHSGAEEVGNYHYTLKTIPEHPQQNKNTQITLIVENSEEKPVTQLNPTIDILRETLTLEETNPGTYTTNYTFKAIGAINLRINVQQDTDQTEIFVTPENLRTQNISTFTIVLIVLFFLTLQTVTLLRIKGKIEFGTTLLILAIVTIILLLVLGFNYYKNSEYNQGCFFNLPDGTKTYHCHQYVHLTICDKKTEFEREAGDLGRGHTHDDGYKIHWHPYQPTPTPEKDMTIKNLFKDLNLEITETTIQNPQTKQIYDSCNGKPATTKVYETLQGQTKQEQITNFLDRPLQDEATYSIIYS